MTLKELEKERERLGNLRDETSANIDKARNDLNNLIVRRDMISGGIQVIEMFIEQEKSGQDKPKSSGAGQTLPQDEAASPMSTIEDGAPAAPADKAGA